MRTKLLNVSGVEVLSRESLKNIQGSLLFDEHNVDLSLCGCSCSGSVTGPFYCYLHMSCPQVYTCDDSDYDGVVNF